jgi:hypothetical protein
MIPTNDQVNKWMIDGDSINELVEFSSKKFINNPQKYTKMFFVELMNQIERWDLVMNYLYIHPIMLPFLLTNLDTEVVKNSSNEMTVWGTKIIALTNIPLDRWVGFADGNSPDSRNIVLGKFDFTVVERLNKIKSFW